MSHESPRLALLLSSYARMIDLIRQVHMMCYIQTYENTHLFISVKGIAESIIHDILLPHLTPLIKRGKISFRIDGNTNQAWNLLDTIRHEPDLSEYDLFLKIDDDDFYHPEYLRYCANAVRMGPPGTSTYVHGEYPTCETLAGTYVLDYPLPCKGGFMGWGNMLGMSPEVISHLLIVIKDKEQLFADFARFGYSQEFELGRKEDRYFFRLMQELGPCVDITPSFVHAGITPVIVGAHRKETSIMRGLQGSKGDFYTTVRCVSREDVDMEREHIVEDGEGNFYSLFLHKMKDLKTGCYARYNYIRDGEIELENGVKYQRREDGKYVKTGRDS